MLYHTVYVYICMTTGLLVLSCTDALVSWSGAADYCNKKRGFLLYTFNATYLGYIIKAYSWDLLAQSESLAKVSIHFINNHFITNV